MRKVLRLLVLSVLAAPLAARADGSIAINLRAGFAKPWGDFAKSNPMSDTLNWAFPLQADLQFRFTRSLQVGAYGRYAPTQTADRYKTLCSAAGSSCSANDIGFGGVVEYRFSDKLEGGGWVGASFGYEMLKLDTVDQTTATTFVKKSATASGLEGGVQAGIDFELGGVAIGPYVQISGGQFSSVKVDSTSTSIPEKKIHGYAGLGVRLALLL